jgi:hypothetical protein
VICTANETGEITLVCGHDALVDEHLGHARHDVEQLTGAGYGTGSLTGPTSPAV